MVVPVVAGIPLVYEMLVGAGILAGGAVAANQMQKEIQTTIDKNPGIIDQALKNVFTGPASRLIDPNFLKEMQAKKPTPTNQGTTKREAIETEVSPDDQGMFIASPEQRAFLFGTRDTPSGTVLAPDATDIEKQRKEAISKPLITPMPVGQQEQTLATPVPEKTTVLPGMDPAPTPIQNEGFSMPTTPDTSILNQDKPTEFKAPSEEVRNTELKLGDELFKLSETGTIQDYETFKNNPIIQNKIKLSEQAYKDTTAVPNYGTPEYWQNRTFANDTKGYKELVKSIYKPKEYDSNKDFYIVMGPSSAGKSTGLVDKLQKETNSFLADSDEIKKLIPEFEDGYNAGGVHKESSDINGRILAMAMKQGKNVIYPTTGREAGKLKGIIDNAEKKGYNVKVNLVTADRSVLLLRNLARMLKTNRVVNGDELLTEELVNGIEETYNNLDEKYKRGKIDTTPKK
jgi:predicted ABC-type ATPase